MAQLFHADRIRRSPNRFHPKTRAGQSARLRYAVSRAEISELKAGELNGTLVRIKDVSAKVATEYSAMRERLLSIPGKISTDLVGLDAMIIETRLRDEIQEALSELKDP